MKPFDRAAQGKNHGTRRCQSAQGMQQEGEQRPLCCIVRSARAKKIASTVDVAERARAGLLAVKPTCPVKFSLGGSSKVNDWELVSVQ